MKPPAPRTEIASTETVTIETLSEDSPQSLWHRVLDLKEWLERSPERTDLYAELALTYQDLGRWREALEWWERYLAQEPSGPMAERGWAEWFWLKGCYLTRLRGLMERLRHPTVRIRRQAAWHLSLFHEPATAAALQTALQDPDPEVRGLAMLALKRIKDELHPPRRH